MPWQHKTLACMDFLCEPWRRLTPCLFLHRFLLTDQIWDRNLVLGAVEKQCSLLFCGSVVLGGWTQRTMETGERERQVLDGERVNDFPKRLFQQCLPSLIWPIRYAEPWGNLIGLITLFSELIQEVQGERGRESLLSSSLWMDTIASVVIIRSVWPSAEANLALLCLPASVRWKQMSALTVVWCSHGRSELRLLACVVSPTRPVGEWEGMDDRYREGHVR